MRIDGPSSSPFAGPGRALAAGHRSRIDAQQLRTALDTFGMLDPDLGAALDAVEAEGAALMEAAVASAGLQLTGTLVDLLA